MGAFQNLKEFQRPVATFELLKSVTTPEIYTYLPDVTHGSLALKAYQQNLYLKYYY